MAGPAQLPSALRAMLGLGVAACSGSPADSTANPETNAVATASTSATTGSGGAASSTAAGGATTTSTSVSTSNATSTVGSTGAVSSSSGGAASTTSTTSTTTGGVGGATSSDVIEQLRAYLALDRTERPTLESQPFADTALTSSEAETARQLFWEDHSAFVTETRQDEATNRSITLDGQTLIYDYTTFGDAPESGHSLYISLHGGGEADASVNDEQWENQKILYQPDEGIYLAPRAPTNTWNLWHEAHIDPLFDRLITNLIVFEGVDPNRVYVMGYSAGGDGVYQLGPRMADYWAAAAMMAGHPNDAQPDSLRNIGFTIHVGGLDTAYDRNLVAEEWGTLLDGLEAADPGGYPHYVEVHPDKPHWMDLEDAVAVPWMAEFTRNPIPERVVWLQDDITHSRFYWLAVEEAAGGSSIVASYSGQVIDIRGEGVSRVLVRLSDAMLDLDQPVTIRSEGTVLFEGMVARDLVALQLTTEERGDPALVFSAELGIELP